MKKIFNSLSNLSLLFYSSVLLLFIFCGLFFVYMKNFCAEQYLSQIAKSALLYIDTEDLKDNFQLFFDKETNLPNEKYTDEISAKLSKLCELHSHKIEFALYTMDNTSAMVKRVLASEKYNFNREKFSEIIEPLLTKNTVFSRQGNFFSQRIYFFKTVLDETGTVAGILSFYTPDTKIGSTTPLLTRLIFLTFTAVFLLLLIAAIYVIKLRPDEDTISISRDIKKEVDVIESSLNQVIGEFEKKNNEFYESINELVLSEKEAVKIVMASGISHELKNYLVPLQGYAILLQKLVNKLDDKELEQKSEKYFSIINNQVMKLDWLSKSLSVISRPSDADYKPVNLNNLIMDSVKLVYSVAAKYAGYELFVDEECAKGATNRKLTVMTCQDAPKVNGDECSLSQLLIALLGNSLNAVEAKGSGEINVGMKRLDESGEFGFYIKDTGTGMTDKIKQFAFEPYLTIIDKPGFGTGMGFVKIIASRHDARIEFSSGLDTGTEVIIWFPPEEQIH